MNERQLFEKSFERPWDFFKLSESAQWGIDSALGLLDWRGEGLSGADMARFRAHYKRPAPALT